MRSFWQAIAGGFIGKILAALSIAVCVMLGFGPEKWALFLMGTSQAGWVWVARIGFVTAGALLLLFVFVIPFFVKSDFIFTWRYRPEDKDWVPFRRTILLKEAARLAYEKLRGRSVSAQKLPAMAADMKFEGEAKPLSWFGHAILKRGEIPVFGSHPPSTKLEIVPKKMTEASGALSDDANSIHYYGEKTPEYISLTIKRTDFQRRLKDITSWHGDDS